MNNETGMNTDAKTCSYCLEVRNAGAIHSSGYPVALPGVVGSEPPQ